MKSHSRFFGPLLILALTYGIFAVQSTHFFTVSNATNILDQAAPLIIVTLGQALVLMTGGFDISVGSMAALSSMVIAMAGKSGGFGAALVGAVLIGTLLGAVNGSVVAYLRVQPVIATLGMLMAARGMALLVTSGKPVVGLPFEFSRLAFGRIGPLPTSVVLAVIAVILMELFLVYTTTGRSILSVGGSATAARLAGVNVSFNRFIAYTICGLLVALAAVLYTARAHSGQPTLGSGLELSSIAAAVIGGTSLQGGVGRMWSAAVGALVIATLANGMNLVGVSPFLQDVVMGFTLLLAVVLPTIGRKGGFMFALKGRTTLRRESEDGGLAN